MAPASAVAKPDGDDVMIVDKLPAKPDDDDDAMPVDKLPEEINEMKIKGERVEKVFYGPFSSATSFFLFSFFFCFFNIYRFSVGRKWKRPWLMEMELRLAILL